jgi:hypothetical protein
MRVKNWARMRALVSLPSSSLGRRGKAAITAWAKRPGPWPTAPPWSA